MATLGAGFNASQHGDMRNFEPIPAAEYLVEITKSDVKPTKNKQGKYIELEFTVIQGEFKGRKIFTNLNIVNKNPVTVDIAQKELATICRAVGKPGGIKDTVELHKKPMLMKVKIKAAKGDYPAKNEPTGYKAGSGSGGPAGGDPAGVVGGGDPDFATEQTQNTVNSGVEGGFEEGLGDVAAEIVETQAEHQEVEEVAGDPPVETSAPEEGVEGGAPWPG